MTALLVLTLIIPFLFLFISRHFRRSPLRHLPGPPSSSFFMGNLQQIHDQENTNLIAQWVSQYGPTFVYRGFLRGRRLITTDPVAVAYILRNSYQYPKPDFIKNALASMAVGYDGLLTVEGDQHQRQRRILTPAFSVSHIKSLTPVFWQKAIQLRDIWLQQLPDVALHQDGIQPQISVARVDVLVWLGRATLDVIGLAGFGYAFDSLTDDSNELACAFDIIFSTSRKFKIMTILQAWFPILRHFRRNNFIMLQAQKTMRRIGLDLINEKRNATGRHPIGVETVGTPKKDKGSGTDLGAHIPQNEIDGAETSQGRDLLSVLIRSNMASAPSQCMSIDEVLCQISTFLAAGHETTCSALTWCLYALAKDQRVQSNLRDALQGIQDRVEVGSGRQETDDTGSGGQQERRNEETLTDEIVKCTYLDWVVRECLRLHAPVTSTMRVCMRDYDEIPLLNPLPCDGERIRIGVNEGANASRHHDHHPMSRMCGNQGAVDFGNSISESHQSQLGSGIAKQTIPIRKWDIISVPIQAINKSEVFWGEDAGVFRPERWAAPPEDARLIPGLYSNMLTFLNGNRACIGYKFAIFEIKIFLYVLLKDIGFSIDPGMIVEKKVNVVARPFVKSESHLGNQLPLNISRVDSRRTRV
ncbi:cytochrome P450 [Phlegmacium glaucopus]|nr:cytochrome P450 [Phlegmacium glaucopus]